MNFSRSAEYFEQANKHLVGGVNSPVRAFKSVDQTPVFIDSAKGSLLTDVDGNTYVDFVGTWGPAILGHAHPEVVAEIAKTAEKGLSFGAPCSAETELAMKIKALLPSADLVRFVSSGTEACMSAVRLARGYTGKDKIIKFTGNYHGHGDSMLVKAGSGVATLGLPDSAGVTKGTAADTLTGVYGDLDRTRELFESNKGQVAALILEPIVGNAGFINPGADFHRGIRNLCDEFGALLIFDEVMTGFRVSLGGAQELFDIRPDLTCLGKVVGGGLPIAAFCGREDVMSHLAPVGPVYQAGTLSGNPLAVASGLKTLEVLTRPGVFEHIEKMTSRLTHGLADAAADAGVSVQLGSAGGMFGMYFSDTPVKNYEQATKTRVDLFKLFHKKMLEKGFYFAPSAYEAGFVSYAHDDKQIDATLAAAHACFSELRP